MPPRLNKRQQRELEELQTLGGRAPQAESDEDEEGEISRPSLPQPDSGFAALMATNDIDDPTESEDDEPKATKSRKAKKKKKKANAEPTKPPKPPQNQATPISKSEKKALKKAKAKEKKAAGDELEQALAELSIKYPASQRMAQKTAAGQTFTDLLSISLQHLDSDAEMRKFFGSKVVQASKGGSSSPAGSSRRQAPAIRSNLTRPQPTWWAAKQREGLSIRPLTDEEVGTKLKMHTWDPVNDEKWWTVEYSKRYKSLTKVFMRTVLSGDPQGFWDLLSKSPWHADTLLQVSEVHRHREEYAQAFDFVDRALFTYERAFIGAFNFTSGSNRLDFDRVENRPFFLAVHRQVADLQRRGCVRTSFEFARLLYGLDPWSDPHGALLHLDYLAVKSGMHQWLIDVFDLFTARRRERKTRQDFRIDPSLLPGWAYAKALALRMVELSEKSESHERSTAALKEALNDFPSVVPLLADKLDVSLPVSVRSHPDFKIETDANSIPAALAALHLLSHLYVQRSSPIWKEHSAWFLQTATETFSSLPSRLPVTQRRRDFLTLYENDGPRYAAYRHLIVLESTSRSLFPFIPRSVQRDSRSLSCDPLPPPDAVSRYDEEFFQGVEELLSFRSLSRRERAADERRLAQMIPDAAFRQQLQASGFFNANPAFGERFPGGIVQFAQALAQLPPEVLEDMMLAEAMNGGAAGGHGAEGGIMPGGLDILDMNGPGPQVVAVQQAFGDVPDFGQQHDEGEAEGEGEDENEEDYEDEDEDEEEDVSPMPRVIRNILGRFWGRPAPEEESSSEEELLDNNGVD